MNQGLHERWDIVLRFMNGPLSLQGELVFRGPVVRIGANPGPGELRLDGYRGLDDRQAVITAYDGGTASIAPVGRSQVRLAPHEHVNWGEVLPLQGPAYLTPGCAIHLGPPGRGASAVFVDCRRLGVWEQRAILSEAQTQPEATEVRELSANAGVPLWFLPAFVGMFATFAVVLGLIGWEVSLRNKSPIGPVEEGNERQDLLALADVSAEAEKLTESVDDAFLTFVTHYNADAAGWPELASNKGGLADKKLMEEVAQKEYALARMNSVWKMFDRAVDQYALVKRSLDKAAMPAVLAAIPFQESGYNASPVSPTCAKGWWQFMPEVALRAQVKVQNCQLSGRLWSPTDLAPVRNSYKNAVYVSYDPEADRGYCILGACEVDERTDLYRSTDGAIRLLKQAWDNPELRASGSLVPLVIASHNAGIDDSSYRHETSKSTTQALPAWQEWKKKKNVTRDSRFFGENLTCRAAQARGEKPAGTCGGLFMLETQNYVPWILAYHNLAVCYYGKNYADRAELREYAPFTAGNGYCRAIAVPSREEISSLGSGKR